MKNFDTRVYSINDFLEWNSSGLLELSPDFQRRGVWSKQAKSYLMDTIINGKPMPKVLMTQNLRGNRSVRTIIDGQQRLRSILEYANDDYTISKSHNREFGGIRFSKLSKNIRSDILKYEVGVDVLFDLSYEETLDIFARLNTYSVKLNNQELLNAKYLGPFKQSCFDIGYSYVNYWIDSGILTKARVARMAEAELASDLFIIAVDGIQTNKQITKYYRNYDDDDIDLEDEENSVRYILDLIMQIYSAEEIKATNYRRIHLYYSLFCALFHCVYGVHNVNATRTKITSNRLSKIKLALDNFSALFDEEDPELEDFIEASRRATTDQSARIFRAEVICEEIAYAISG